MTRNYSFIIDNEVVDVTNGDIKLYLNEQFQIDSSNNLVVDENGAGYNFSSSNSVADLTVRMIFGYTSKNGRFVMRDFVTKIIGKIITLVEVSELGEKRIDILFSSVTRHDKHFNGALDEQITFNIVVPWYSLVTTSSNVPAGYNFKLTGTTSGGSVIVRFKKNGIAYSTYEFDKSYASGLSFVMDTDFNELIYAIDGINVYQDLDFNNNFQDDVLAGTVEVVGLSAWNCQIKKVEVFV
jgi:hypothetical protein